ncbi:MAG TPA: CAP domain-containing protein [Phycisphaerae bacterium]|nr:CAP domain-containing protein [Phycisphaerae bacterium]HRY68013.1 CAP domain-containing protein [Phycisphaerae bacterium]HSA26750.1 CAP domain-containing protein [Phycisphaerae bacterium]
MTARRWWVSRMIAPVLAISLLWMAGCPGTGGSEQTYPLTNAVVKGIQAGTRVASVPNNNDALVAGVHDLVNEERTGRGLRELALNSTLCSMAESYCEEMIEEGFFAHENPNTGETLGQRAVNAGYVFLAIGENLAGGQTSPDQVVAEWMRSTQGHRENILAAQWREVGIGVRTGGDYGVYWVLEFGNPP